MPWRQIDLSGIYSCFQSCLECHKYRLFICISRKALDAITPRWKGPASATTYNLNFRLLCRAQTEYLKSLEVVYPQGSVAIQPIPGEFMGKRSRGEPADAYVFFDFLAALKCVCTWDRNVNFIPISFVPLSPSRYYVERTWPQKSHRRSIRPGRDSSSWAGQDSMVSKTQSAHSLRGSPSYMYWSRDDIRVCLTNYIYCLSTQSWSQFLDSIRPWWTACKLWIHGTHVQSSYHLSVAPWSLSMSLQSTIVLVRQCSDWWVPCTAWVLSLPFPLFHLLPIR